MRLLVGSVPLAGGVIGAGGEIAWPRPTRPGDVLTVVSEVLEVTPSRSRPDRGMVTLRSETRNQRGEVVQILTARLVVPRRPAAGLPPKAAGGAASRPPRRAGRSRRPGPGSTAAASSSAVIRRSRELRYRNSAPGAASTNARAPGGLEHAGVERPALPDPVQLARERLPLAPGHDARGREPARAVQAPEAAEQRLALDPPVRHAQPQHRALLRRGRSGGVRCRVRPALAGLHRGRAGRRPGSGPAATPARPAARVPRAFLPATFPSAGPGHAPTLTCGTARRSASPSCPSLAVGNPTRFPSGPGRRDARPRPAGDLPASVVTKTIDG